MYPRLYKCLKNKSFFIFGPRATGKSSWIKENYSEAQIIDLLSDETQTLLRSNPSRLESFINPGQKLIAIDEIQKVPALLDEVHRLIELKKLKFILTGSSARKLKRGAANLLAGRALQTFFYPFTCWELGKYFNFKKSLQSGLLPLAYQSDNSRQYLATYINTYLKEEILAEGLLRNLEPFSRFLEAMSFSQAQVLSYAAIGRDSSIDPKLVRFYVDMLCDLLIGHRLEVFTRKAKRKMAVQEKFFFFDVGMWRQLRPKGPLDSESEIDGAALETLFFQHYMALSEFVGWDQKLYYWRTQSKLEVDFVSYGSLGLFAFECKKNSTIRSDDLIALKAFKDDYPMAKCFVFYGGHEKKFFDGIHFIPMEEALVSMPSLFGVEL